MRAVLAADEPWAPAGHEVAWGQLQLTPGAASRACRRGGRRPSPPAATVSLGPGRFDAATGVLTALGDLALDGPRLDVWRAPTDNDTGMHGPDQLEAAWRALGLHRVRHRVLAVEPGPDGLVVRTRVGMAGVGRRPARDLRVGGRRGRAAASPSTSSPKGNGPFRCPGSACGSRCPAALDRVEWFGRGPGEAYRDTRRAARVGRFAASVDELQTPYVRPQENGNRTEVRWATLTDAAGAGLRVEGRPHIDLTARRWTSEDLDAATHTPELVAARPDLGQPRPRPAGHRHGLLRAGRAPAAPPRGRCRRRFALRLSPVSRSRA